MPKANQGNHKNGDKVTPDEKESSATSENSSSGSSGESSSGSESEEGEEREEREEREGGGEGEDSTSISIVHSYASDPVDQSERRESGTSDKSVSLPHQKRCEYPLEDEIPNGATIYIGEGSEFWRTNGVLTIQFDSPKTIRLIDIAICYVSEIHDCTVPNFKSPDLVTNINFDGTMFQNNFNTLLCSLVNLKYLGIHLSSFYTLQITTMKGLDLPSLENLTISAIGFTEDMARCIDMHIILNNIIAILQFCFPKMTYLSISCPTVMCREQEFTEAILNFLHRHKCTMKFLNLECLWKMGSAFFNCREEPECPDDEDPEFPPVEFDLSELKGLSLTSFHLFLAQSTGTTELWRNFLLTQKELEYIQFWCETKQFTFYPLIANIVRHNTRTLNTFAFNLQYPPDHKPIDCVIFKDACNLTTILLKSSKVNRSSVGIVNFKLMPTTLRYIKILMLPMDKSDLTFVATKLPRLTRLFLEDVGGCNNLGLSLQDLCNLLQRKYTPDLQSLHIVRSLNRSSFEEPPEDVNKNHDGYRIMAKIIFKSQRDLGFQAELDEYGEFDIVQCETPECTEPDEIDEGCPIPHPKYEENNCNILYANNGNNLHCESSSILHPGGGEQCPSLGRRTCPMLDECCQVEENQCKEVVPQMQCVEEGLQAGPGSMCPRPRTQDMCVQCYEEDPQEDCGYQERRSPAACGFERERYRDHASCREPSRPNCNRKHEPSNCNYSNYNNSPQRSRREFVCYENHHHHEQEYNSGSRPRDNNNVSRYQRQPQRQPNPYTRQNTNRGRVNIPETIHEHYHEHDHDHRHDYQSQITIRSSIRIQSDTYADSQSYSGIPTPSGTVIVPESQCTMQHHHRH